VKQRRFDALTRALASAFYSDTPVIEPGQAAQRIPDISLSAEPATAASTSYTCASGSRDSSPPNVAAAHDLLPICTGHDGPVRLARDRASPTAGRAGPAAAGPAPTLTPREWEVAVLVARGLRNREIATALIVSERTVHAHVRSILGKLGLTSRAQVALWSVRQGLARGIDPGASPMLPVDPVRQP
jgi:DNA-binding CsgD family transcriptional regulator